MRTWNKLEVNLEDFDPAKTDYSAAELEAYTNAMLKKQAREGKPINTYPQILFDEHIANRVRPREILTATGETPDPTITNSLSPDGHMIYNRTHPEGRKVNSDRQRKEHGASYYK